MRNRLTRICLLLCMPIMLHCMDQPLIKKDSTKIKKNKHGEYVDPKTGLFYTRFSVDGNDLDRFMQSCKNIRALDAYMLASDPIAMIAIFALAQCSITTDIQLSEKLCLILPLEENIKRARLAQMIGCMHDVNGDFDNAAHWYRLSLVAAESPTTVRLKEIAEKNARAKKQQADAAQQFERNE